MKVVEVKESEGEVEEGLPEFTVRYITPPCDAETHFSNVADSKESVEEAEI